MAFAMPAQGGPYAPAALEVGSTAIGFDDVRIESWATTVIDVVRGPIDATVPEGVAASFGDAIDALGAAWEGDVYGVVSLGDGGYITLGFERPITNGEGADFAIFENSFSDTFLELAFVEVSSNGMDYFRFDSISLTPLDTQTPTFDANMDATNIFNLAGKYGGGYGTPFDLAEMAEKSPLLDVNSVTHVRVRDVVGSIDPLYATFDSVGHIINDPWKTSFSTGGFDLDAIGVLHSVPEPSVIPLILLAAAGFVVTWKRKGAAINGSRIGRGKTSGFTLVELLVTITILAILAGLVWPAASRAIKQAKASRSMSNLRQLVIANHAYAAENDGYYCPAQDARNLVRWHGARTSTRKPFDPKKGFLSPYLGKEASVKMCPLFSDMLTGDKSFETSTGGYGYNASYIGGTPDAWDQPTTIARISRPARTIMFTTTAFARSKGVQEYPYSEPFSWIDPNDNIGGPLQPSVHFRANGKALVAWCDGHVTAEPPSKIGGTDYYGGDSKREKIGWFGPSEQNGYWNPDYQPRETTIAQNDAR